MNRSMQLVLLACCALATTASADESFKNKLNDTVAEHWVYDNWQKAVETAQREKKPILAVFRCVP